MKRHGTWINTFRRWWRRGSGDRPGEARWLMLCGNWTPEELHQLTKHREHSSVMRARLDRPDREGVRIIVRNQYDELLMQLRTEDAPTNPGMWTAPGGPMEPGETPEQGARRELAEETGLYPEIITPLGVLYFTAPQDGDWVCHHVYTADTTLGENDLILGEGQAWRFVDWSELPQLQSSDGISPSARNALAIAWLAAPANPPWIRRDRR